MSLELEEKSYSEDVQITSVIQLHTVLYAKGVGLTPPFKTATASTFKCHTNFEVDLFAYLTWI